LLLPPLFGMVLHRRRRGTTGRRIYDAKA
jgi:hypothetical protein